MSVYLGKSYQDKNESLPYTIDFGTDLGSGVTITNASWALSTDFTVENTSYSGTVANIRLSGGTAGKTYKLECTVDGSDGSRHQGHFELEIQN